MNPLQRIFAPAILDHAPDLSHSKQICIGTLSDSLTEVLYLSALPSSLKARFPHLSVSIYSAQMNPVVFSGNPNIGALVAFPKSIYGKRIPGTLAHPIQSLEQGLGVSMDTAPTPEIYLTEHEVSWARTFLKSKRLPINGDKPLCLIHPWKKRHRRSEQLLAVEVWDRIASELALRYRVWQVGMWDQPALKNCEYYLLSSGSRWEAREMFSLMSQAQMFVGLASAPMHVAKALKVPSITLVNDDPDAGLYKDGYAISVNDQSTESLLSSLRSGLQGSR